MKDYMEVLINPPKEIYTTLDEFMHFSFYEIASFFCNCNLCFSKNEDGSIKLWTSRSNLAYACLESRRFKGLNWKHNEGAEFYHCTIPKDNKLFELIERKCQHIFLK